MSQKSQQSLKKHHTPSNVISAAAIVGRTGARRRIIWIAVKGDYKVTGRGAGRADTGEGRAKKQSDAGHHFARQETDRVMYRNQ
jgi:hypothetical protein